MAKVKIGKPPAGLSGEQLASWFDDQYEDAYEKQLFDAREARRKADAAAEESNTKLVELKTQIPDENSVVLKGKDAEKWAELGTVDLAALKTKAEEGDRLVRRSFLTEVAAAAGFNPKQFAELVELRGYQVEAREVDGKRNFVVVTKDGEATKDVSVAEHFKTAEADWLPALTPPTDGRRPLGTPPTGRLPSDPPGRSSDDPQLAYLQRQTEDAAKHQNVLARSFNPPVPSGGKT